MYFKDVQREDLSVLPGWAFLINDRFDRSKTKRGSSIDLLLKYRWSCVDDRPRLLELGESE